MRKSTHRCADYLHLCSYNCITVCCCTVSVLYVLSVLSVFSEWIIWTIVSICIICIICINSFKDFASNSTTTLNREIYFTAVENKPRMRHLTESNDWIFSCQQQNSILSADIWLTLLWTDFNNNLYSQHDIIGYRKYNRAGENPR